MSLAKNNKKASVNHRRSSSNKLSSPRDCKCETTIMAGVNKVGEGLSNLSLSSGENLFDAIRKSNATKSSAKAKEYFNAFDVDCDGFLNEQEFETLLKQLFSNRGKPYTLSEKQTSDIFKLIDENQDGKIDLKEFTECWHHWMKQVLDPVTALVVVDVQNDFISGTMAVCECPAGQDGEAVVPCINKLLDTTKFDVVIYSADWHPDNHISFLENVKNRKLHHTSKISAENARKMDTVVFEGTPLIEQKLWPKHCVQGTWGSELHKDLKVVENAVFIHKGTNPDIDSYSAFWDNNKLSQTGLINELTSRGITDVYVCGLAYDICVGATTAHALEHGFRTILIEDAARGVDLDEIKKTHDKLFRQGAALVNSDAVPDMVNAEDRRPDLGYKAALNFAMARKLVKTESSSQADTKEMLSQEKRAMHMKAK